MHDTAATPHRRAHAHPNLPTTAKATLNATYFDINPAALQRHIQALMNELLTLAKALATGDMICGGRLTLDLDVAKQNELFDVARSAWAQAGKPKPHLGTSFWFALGSIDDARQQMHTHLRRYMNWIPADYLDAMAPGTGFAGSEHDLIAVLRAFEAVGADEIQLIPTSSDLDQLRRAADLVATMTGGA